jgi:anti-sigma B factor antagonist
MLLTAGSAEAGVKMPGGSRRIHQPAVPGPWTVVVKLPAEVDFSNKSLVLATLAGALGSRPKVVVADGTGTGFCDCAAIHTLITAHHEAIAADAQLRVVTTGALVRRVLELTGADRILLVYPSLADAHADHPTSSLPPSMADSEHQLRVARLRSHRR